MLRLSRTCQMAAIPSATRGSRWLASAAVSRGEETERELVERLRAKFEVKDLSDWKKVSTTDVVAEGGSSLLARHSYSFFSLLQAAHPDETLSPVAVRKKVPNGYWNSKENRVRFLKMVAETHGVEKAEDWQRVSSADLKKLGGSGLLRARGVTSLYDLLTEMYPGEDVAMETLRTKRSNGFWQDASNRRAFLEEVALKHGAQTGSDWKKVSYADVTEMGGAGLLAYYGGSVFRALADLFPEKELTVSETRNTVPRNHWSDADNRKSFLEEVRQKHGIETAADWSKVTTKDVGDMGGNGLLQKYGNSMFAMLQEVYGEEVDERKSRSRLPRAFWNSEENRRRFMDEVAEEFSIRQPEDWKRVTHSHLEERGGGALVARYGGVHGLLQAVYPEETFDELECRAGVPLKYWLKKEHVVSFMAKMKRELALEEKEDWYRVSYQQIRALSGSGLLRTMRYVDALRLAYPSEEWDEAECSRRVKKSTQRQLLLEVKKMLPEGTELLEDHWHPALAAEHGGKGLELDIFLPQFNLALEYNGIHHYQEMGFFGPVDAYMARDKEKEELCRRHGITLVVVPYWWDQTRGSLAATLHNAMESLPLSESVLADIREGKHSAIPTVDPAAERKGVEARTRPGVWHTGIDPSDMLMYRRYEGIAVRWEAEGRRLSSRRTGRLLRAPAKWLAGIPETRKDLEGDLWVPGGQGLGRLSGLAMAHGREAGMGEEIEDGSWEEVVFMASDVADSAAPFASRVQELRELPTTSQFRPVEVLEGESAEVVGKRVEEDGAEGGAGWVLREKSSLFRHGMTTQPMLRARHVQEAEVIMVEPCAASRGFVVQLPSSGALQIARCSGLEYLQPPPKGTSVRVGHFGTWSRTSRLKYPFVTGITNKRVQM